MSVRIASLAVSALALLALSSASRSQPSGVTRGPDARQAPAGGAVLVLRNVTVVDVDGRPSRPGMTVVTEGDRIVQVARSDDVRSPDVGATTVDGSGKFLIPGLWDMHTHFTAAPESLRLFVANGVTGVRDMGSLVVEQRGDRVEFVDRQMAIRTILDARERVRRGELLGPTILTAGMIVSGPHPDIQPDLPMHLIVRDAAEARLAVASLADAGVDFIKVHVMLPRDAYFAVMEEARRRKLAVAGHVPRAITAVEASQAGQASMEHLHGAPEYAYELVDSPDDETSQRRIAELVTLYASNRNWQVPTLVSFARAALAHDYYTNPASDPQRRFASPLLRGMWKSLWPPDEFSAATSARFRGSVRMLSAMTRQMHAGGVPILAGSDCGGLFTYPGFSLHEELELLNEAGLSPAESLRAATLAPAIFLGMADAYGTIAPGKVANLVLLERDPLADIRHTRSIAAVVLRGQLFDRPALQRLLDESAAPRQD